MRNPLLIAVVVFLGILLSGCTDKHYLSSDNSVSKLDQYDVTNEVTEGDFVFRLFSEREEYGENESISIYAELEYIGNKKKVTIYHAGSPFYFPISEKTRNYEIPYPMILPRLSSVLNKGVPLVKKYQGSGAYGSEDENEYAQFMKSIMENKFPTGDYVVNGFADFSIEYKDEEIRVNLGTQINFKVLDNSK
jgi:hypothetical protein